MNTVLYSAQEGTTRFQRRVLAVAALVLIVGGILLQSIRFEK